MLVFSETQTSAGHTGSDRMEIFNRCANPIAFLASVGLATAIGCTKPQQVEMSSARASGCSSVASFEVNVLDLANETAFLKALDFVPEPFRALDGAQFARLLGVPGARAREVRLSLGEQRFDIRQFLAPRGHAVPVIHANDLGFEHIAIVVRDMAAAHARLLHSNAALVSTAPQTLPANNPVAAGIRAEYFRDPEGHFMELIQFPEDKGDPKWHRATPSLFLGLDHSAIAVKSSAVSVHFYRDLLGLRVVSESLNQGREQEELSGVPGARVRITSLRGEQGPGIELLDYLAPDTGAPFPMSSPADALHWEITIRVASLERTLSVLREAGFDADPRPSDPNAPISGLTKASQVRDPDGHTVRIIEGGS